MVEQNLLELGAIAVLFLIAIREFFSYLKSKGAPNQANCKGNDAFNKAILEELQLMNSNHLHTIQKCVEDGNKNLVETIHNDNTKMIEILGRIEGNLSARR